MMHAGGRPKSTSIKGLTVDQWLQGYLSGGSRPVLEIREVGERQGFGWRTVERAKLALGIASIRVGHEWHWKDKSVPDAVNQIERSKKQRVSKLVAESDYGDVDDLGDEEDDLPPSGPIDLNAVDERGYLTSSPRLLGIKDAGDPTSSDVTPQVITRKIRALYNEGSDADIEIVRKVFAFAYPAAGFSESVIASMLKANLVKVGPKSEVFGTSSTQSKVATSVSF
jgi:hypothetical protein